MSPRALFRGVAVAEALTWAGLLVGMALKYGSETTELGVRIFGPLHGVAFIAFCLTTVVVGVDQQWRSRRVVTGLLSAVPPFATLAFERYAERRDGLRPTWQLLERSPTTASDRVTAWLVRKPRQGLAAGAAAVGVLTAAALLVGPPG